MPNSSQLISKAALATVVAAVGGTAFGQINPVYLTTAQDAVTGDNAFNSGGFRRWDVDAGSDSYQNDFYERPTVQTYAQVGGRYATEEYFEFLDIVQAKVGYDNRFVYVAIDMYGRDKSTKDGVDTEVGMLERYGFRIGTNADGRNSRLLVADQPETNGTSFSRLKTFGYRDTDGDVGGRGIFNGGATGLSVTKSDNILEEAGMNGYDAQIISDGQFGGRDVLFSRLDPTDDTVVELALDYTALGMNLDEVLNTRYLEIEAVKGGPKDPQNYLWNDKYTKLEAGSPIGGANGLSEFGTQGLGNIYELDTLRTGVVPEPGTMIVLGAGLAALMARRRRSG